ncbi:malate synthase [Oceanobacillus sp. AG]|uniref:malate synthase n=1 Tax=Oceanobacillus sp. AG TaxID=2681969 RepID=UPI0012EB31B5|nr:malate synthase [Oceanobacillus sp. AG]
MNLIDKKVMHKSFGNGSIVDQDDEFVTIDFDEVTKKFVFPDAFGKFLKLKDDSAQATLKQAITKIEAKQEQLEKEREEEQAQRILEQQRMNELKKLLKNHRLHDKSQLVFWLEDTEEEQAFTDWQVFAGEIRSGKNEGKPNKPVRLHQNSLVLLTKRDDKEEEKERKIVGLYMVEETFIGRLAEDGIIPAHSELRLKLSDEEAEDMLFWNYYINEKYPHRMTWNTGKYRYFDNIWAAQILKDIIALKKDPNELQLAEEFFLHFCKMNQLEPNEIPEPNGALKYNS